MKIALRTSGGRGEYELAGRQGNMSANDLEGLPIFYEFTPDLIIPAHSSVKTDQGKPRLRLRVPRSDRHLYLLLADILLLPKPKRELDKTTPSVLTLKNETYSISEVKVDISEHNDKKIVLRPTDVLLANKSGQTQAIGFFNRMARILEVWDAAEQMESSLANLVHEHQRAITRGSGNHASIKDASIAIRKYLMVDADPLPLIEKELGIDIEEEPEDAEVAQRFVEDDNTTPIEAKQRQIRQWRQQAIRGSKGNKFRNAVRQAYRNTCLFSGMKLPKIGPAGSAGVDAAHILPWANFDIDSVANGICLSKMCHWAFDAGILRLDFDNMQKVYHLEVPREIEDAAKVEGFDLSYFKSLAGVIPSERLPNKKSEWPRPELIKKLNESVF